MSIVLQKIMSIFEINQIFYKIHSNSIIILPNTITKHSALIWRHLLGIQDQNIKISRYCKICSTTLMAAAAAPEDCSRQGPSGKGKPTTSTMYYGLVFPRKSISTPYTPSSSCSSSAFLPAFACSSAVCLFLRKTQLSDQGNGKISVKVA